MAVDPARQHQSARGIDLLCRPWQRLGQRDDTSPAYADIALEAIGRGAKDLESVAQRMRDLVARIYVD